MSERQRVIEKTEHAMAYVEVVCHKCLGVGREQRTIPDSGIRLMVSCTVCAGRGKVFVKRKAVWEQTVHSIKFMKRTAEKTGKPVMVSRARNALGAGA